MLNFWTDKWIRECSPRELIKGPINKMESNMAVADMLQGNEWNWNALSFELPTSISRPLPFRCMEIKTR